MPATASAKFRRAESAAASPGEEADDDVDRQRDPTDVQAGEPSRLGIAADRVDVPAEAGVAQHDVGKDGKGER